MLSSRLEIVLPKPKEAAQLTFVYWLAILLVYAPAVILTGQIQGAGEILHMILSFICVVLLAGLLYLCLRGMAGRRLWIAVPALLMTLTVTSALQTAVDYALQHLMHLFFSGHRIPDQSLQSILLVTFVNWLMCACNVALLWVSSTARRIRLREVELARSEAAALEAQLNMLRMQLNPHFMSNSLNVISSLILTNASDEAYRMTDRLAHFLRASMAIEGLEKELGDELEVIEAYCEVERARFGERVEIHIECDPAAERAIVPNFIFQPLVENALKYAVHRSHGRVQIRVAAHRVDDVLKVSVEDVAEEAPVKNVESGSGVGLANVRSRLQLLFGNDAMLVTEPRESGFMATITLPYYEMGESKALCAA